jgi:hypothetical protein
MALTAAIAAASAAAATTTTYLLRGDFTSTGTLPSGGFTGELTVDDTPTSTSGGGTDFAENFALLSGYLEFGSGPSALTLNFQPSSVGVDDANDPEFFQINTAFSGGGFVNFFTTSGDYNFGPPPRFTSWTDLPDPNMTGPSSYFGRSRPPLSNVQIISFDEQVSSVPEPRTWLMMIMGAGLAGGALRRRRMATAKLA